MTEKFTFFWNGPKSQWSYSPFFIDSIEYNCAEQYMMAEKARLFNDQESLEKIMNSDSPRQQKAYGRSVKNFDPKLWDERSWGVVERGTAAKYSQSVSHMKDLRESIGTTIVEASPYDVIWGIGLSETDPRRFNRKFWLGENRLGVILTRFRIEFFGE